MRKLHLFLMLLSIVILSACSTYGEKLTFNGTEVYYTSQVTQQEAEKLGKFLIDSEFADGNRKSVQLTKDEATGNFVFRMVTKKEAVDNKVYEVLFKAVAIQISDSVFNKQPVDFEVCNASFKTLKTIPFKTKADATK